MWRICCPITPAPQYVCVRAIVLVSHITQRDYDFSTAVRKTFLGAFVDMLLDVDTFLVLPDDTEAWLEGNLRLFTTILVLICTGSLSDMNTFDKIAFLTDQTHENLAFLECFVETQLFASFLDKRVCSRIIGD